MTSERRLRLRFGPDRPDAPVHVRRLRVWTMVSIWVFVLVFFVLPIGFGSFLFAVPAVVFTVMLVASVRISRRPDGPDAETLHKGELAGATPDEPVAVNGLWSTGLRARGEPTRRGWLVCDGERLRFEDVDGVIRFDTTIDRVGFVGPPTFFRPQLDLRVGGTIHSIRFFAVYDLGASFVGPTVVGEWYAQLRELGAS